MTPDECARRLEDGWTGESIRAEAAEALRRLGRLERVLEPLHALVITGGRGPQRWTASAEWVEGDVTRYLAGEHAEGATPLEALLGLAERLEREERG
jgi:hypothetical protein